MIDAVEGKAYNQLADAEMKQFSEGEAVALDFNHGSNNFTPEKKTWALLKLKSKYFRPTFDKHLSLNTF